LDMLPSRYLILEVSSDLKQRQQTLLLTRLPHLFDRVSWLTSLPNELNGIILANEVIDALPVKRFVIEQGSAKELGVSVDAGEFIWQPQTAPSGLLEELNRLSNQVGRTFSEGYRSEVSILLPSWIRSLEQALKRGLMLFVDYGLSRKQFYSEDRVNGTLNCFFKHHQHDNPFVNLGIQDITAWVDFTALAEAGTHAEMELCGYSTQAHFLIGAGVDKLMNVTMNREGASDTQRWQLSQQAQQLMLPDAMGESFKAMAFRKNCDVELSGFGVRDLRHLL